MKPIKPDPAQAALIRRALCMEPSEETPDLYPAEGGLTNHSFRFSCRGQDYLFREPGQDSFTYINRYQEAGAYAAVRGVIPTDELVALEPESGRKITRFWRTARTCDPSRESDVQACMAMLRRLHGAKLQVKDTYSLCDLNRAFIGWKTTPSVYPDYREVEKRCMDMEPILAKYRKYAILSHCDTVADNFLFIEGASGSELRLIDWEYAGMHDPAVDVAMFANDGGYTPEQVEWLMECYLGRTPDPEYTLRVYGYLALTGLCYSNWAERQLEAGIDWGDYGPGQYGRAQLYSKLFWELLPKVPGGGAA